ncbi:MAG: carboxypeptidase-like regulatory domain-containing protein [Parabacteroides merdae]
MCTTTLSYAQHMVSGVVKDVTGEPIIGANVVEKGTTNGSITDIDGELLFFHL